MTPATHNAKDRADTTDRMPSGFRLATPANWFDLDLDPETRHDSIAALVDARIAKSPEIAPRREELVRMLLDAAHKAAANGIVFSSIMAESVDGAGMSANIAVALTAATTADKDGPAVNDPKTMAAFFRHVAGKKQSEYKQDVSIVELDSGSAVRLAGLKETPIEAEHQMLVTHTVQYFIPVPASKGLAVVTCTTPTIALGEGFSELFDALSLIHI